MHKLKYLPAILIAVAALGLQQAQAHLLAPFEFTHSGPIGSPANETSYLKANGGGIYQPTFIPQASQFLGKFDRNDNNTNTVTNGAVHIADFVDVTFNSNVATVSWDFTGSHISLDGLLLKDGNLGGQLYSFFGVSADETIMGSGTVSFSSGRNISHISFFGVQTTPFGAPDGGTTVMLLGGALSVLGIARRYLKS